MSHKRTARISYRNIIYHSESYANKLRIEINNFTSFVFTYDTLLIFFNVYHSPLFSSLAPIDLFILISLLSISFLSHIHQLSLQIVYVCVFVYVSGDNLTIFFFFVCLPNIYGNQFNHIDRHFTFLLHHRL